MRILASIISGFMIGAFVGYLLGVLVFCTILHPDMPQCGLVAVFVTGPAGAVLGAIVGPIITSRWRPSGDEYEHLQSKGR